MISTATSPATLAHVLRLVGASIVVALMAVLGVLQPTVPSAGGTTTLAPSSDASTSLDAAIRAQQAQGRTCREVPALTDAVLYQFAGADKIAVLTFDQAVRETARRSGWVRGYCI